jgi:hypothetical protein
MVGRLNINDRGLSFSALAQETISGGQLVKAVSGATVLTATNSIENVIEVAKCDAAGDNVLCVGVAQTNAASGGRVTVTGRGIHGFYAADAIACGAGVMCADSVTSADAITDSAFAGTGSKVIGFALSTAASGQLCAVQLTL